jgi:hypothetical protein
MTREARWPDEGRRETKTFVEGYLEKAGKLYNAASRQVVS